jgi:ATP-dependent helicase/nuclease subunit A
VAATALTDEGAPEWGDGGDLATAPSVDPGGPAVAGTATTPAPPATLFDALDTLDAVAAVGEIHQGLRNELDGIPGEPDPALRKRPKDLDLPPWVKGRYGTAIGRAVHGVLQTIDLATGAGLDDAVAAQCQAEAVPDRMHEVRSLVEDALTSPVVQAAATSRHWREVYACTPIGDRLLEGYVDLLYRSADGLVVVDHKTSASSDPAELDRRVAGYRLQGAAYAVAVGRATAEPVTRVVFLFLTPEGAVERDLTDLAAAMADVERLVSNGAELVTP